MRICGFKFEAGDNTFAVVLIVDLHESRVLWNSNHQRGFRLHICFAVDVIDSFGSIILQESELLAYLCLLFQQTPVELLNLAVLIEIVEREVLQLILCFSLVKLVSPTKINCFKLVLLLQYLARRRNLRVLLFLPLIWNTVYFFLRLFHS